MVSIGTGLTERGRNKHINKGRSLKMKAFSFLLLSIGISVLATTPTHADSLVGVFNISNGITTNTIGGQITFSLNDDGTIAANLFSNSGGIVGFGYDSPWIGVSSSGLPTGYINTMWMSGVGNYASGIYWEAQNLPPPENITWQIGTPGQFTSVWQAVGGNSPYDFFLYPKSMFPEEWTANAVSSVPEANTYAMMLAGLGLVGAVARRRRG